MQNNKEFKQLLWHSRRGMRELDAFMIPFTKNIYPGLQPQEQLMYRELLTQNDELLYRWFLTSENAGIRQVIIDKVIDYAVQNTKNTNRRTT